MATPTSMVQPLPQIKHTPLDTLAEQIYSGYPSVASGVSPTIAPKVPPPGSVASPTPTTGASSAFDFPLDKFPKSYSGIGPEATGMLSSLIPQVKEAALQYPETVKGGYGQAISDVGKSYGRTLQPQLQQILNNLAKRNVISSSVAGEALGGAARGVASDVIGQQANLGFAREQALAQYPQLLTNLLGQGRYTESSDEGVPYRSALGFLQSLMA